MAVPEYIPQYILTTEDFAAKSIVTAEHWNEIFNLLISQGNDTAHMLVDLILSLPENFVTQARIGVSNGVAGLDVSGKVPMAQLPLVNNLISTNVLTLPLAGWSNKVQTITAPNVRSNNIVLVSATPNCSIEYAYDLVICTSQGLNTLTFTCETEPENTLMVNIIIIDLAV